MPDELDGEVLVGVGSLASHLASPGASLHDAPGLQRPSVPLSPALGPHHPTEHGLLQLRLRVAGQRIVQAEPIVGQLHRGAEKLFEARDYRQLMVLANRHDWLAGFSGELGVALLVEDMVGIEVPPRAVWLRTLLAELERVHSHLVFLAEFPVGTRPLIDLERPRKLLRGIVAAACGGPVHPMLARVGGLRQDVSSGWLADAASVISGVRRALPGLRAVLEDTDLPERTQGVGVLTAATAAAFGVTGPPARAGGLDLDLRRDEPYLGYGELFAPGGPGRVITAETGDVFSRLRLLAEQVSVSLDLADACLERVDRVGSGPVNVRLPKTLRVPEGDGYTATEGPSGVNGYYLVSRGAKTPWRLALRAASFNNVSALSAVLPGTRVSDLTAVLASLFVVVGDLAK